MITIRHFVTLVGRNWIGGVVLWFCIKYCEGIKYNKDKGV